MQRIVLNQYHRRQFDSAPGHHASPFGLRMARPRRPEGRSVSGVASWRRRTGAANSQAAAGFAKRAPLFSGFTTVKQLLVIARSEATKQSRMLLRMQSGLLRFARNDGERHDSASRGAFRVRAMHRLRPSQVRGRRECRVLDAPVAACAVVVSTRVSHHRHTGTSGIPCAMVLRLMSALSSVSGLDSHRHP